MEQTEQEQTIKKILNTISYLDDDKAYIITDLDDTTFRLYNTKKESINGSIISVLLRENKDLLLNSLSIDSKGKIYALFLRNMKIGGI